MAKRIAIFVEGQTEQIFIEKLLSEIAGHHKITIGSVEIRGQLRILSLQGGPYVETPYYALVCDCGADNSVVSDMNDNYESLVKAGYSLILGLRDVHPIDNADLPDLRAAILAATPRGSVPSHVILAIREIEAWFFVEDLHYPSIHPNLTSELIKTNLGIDPATVPAESIAHPSAILHDAYQLQGRAYHKSKRHVQRTVNALDYARLNFELATRIASLGELCYQVNGFFA
jgi:hypothetical protein